MLVVTAPGSGAEIIPFLKTWVNLPMAVGFTVLYAKVSSGEREAGGRSDHLRLLPDHGRPLHAGQRHSPPVQGSSNTGRF